MLGGLVLELLRDKRAFLRLRQILELGEFLLNPVVHEAAFILNGNHLGEFVLEDRPLILLDTDVLSSDYILNVTVWDLHNVGGIRSLGYLVLRKDRLRLTDFVEHNFVSQNVFLADLLGPLEVQARNALAVSTRFNP